MKILITKIVYDYQRGRVYFEADVEGKKKRWNVAIGLFDVLLKLEGVEDLTVNVLHSSSTTLCRCGYILCQSDVKGEG